MKYQFKLYRRTESRLVGPHGVVWIKLPRLPEEFSQTLSVRKLQSNAVISKTIRERRGCDHPVDTVEVQEPRYSERICSLLVLSCRLLNAGHFAEDEARSGHLDH